jgi:hypothetical protein
VLEVVEVDEQQRAAGAGRGRFQTAFEPLQQKRPVGQTGEPVMRGVEGQSRRGLDAIGDVVAVDDDAADRRVADSICRGQLDVPDLAAGLNDPAFRGANLIRGRRDTIEYAEKPRPVVGVDQLGQRSSDPVGGRLSPHRQKRGAGVADDRVRVEDADDVGAVLQQRREPTVRCFELATGLVTLGDVDHGQDDTGHRAGLVQERSRRGAEPGELAVVVA